MDRDPITDGMLISAAHQRYMDEVRLLEQRSSDIQLHQRQVEDLGNPPKRQSIQNTMPCFPKEAQRSRLQAFIACMGGSVSIASHL